MKCWKCDSEHIKFAQDSGELYCNDCGANNNCPYDKGRDTRKLGPYYTRHLRAMTEERLDNKGDIASELAWRDKWIASLRETLSRVNVQHEDDAKTLAEVRSEIGEAWFAGGCSIAEALRRKTSVLEAIYHKFPREVLRDGTTRARIMRACLAIYHNAEAAQNLLLSDATRENAMSRIRHFTAQLAVELGILRPPPQLIISQDSAVLIEDEADHG